MKNSNKKVLFNSFFNNNEIFVEKKIHSFKQKNENISQFSDFPQNQDSERSNCSRIDKINNENLILNKNELRSSKMLYSSVLKFPENGDENPIVKVDDEDEISTKIIPSKKTLIEKIEITSMSNMEKLLKKIEENQIKMAEIAKIDFKNIPRIISGEKLNKKNDEEDEDKIVLKLSDLEFQAREEYEASDDSLTEDFDVLEKESLELVTRF